MAHHRALIRKAIRDTLLNNTAAGIKVYRSRTALQSGRDLPLIGIYTLNETIVETSVSSAPRRYERRLSVVVGAVVAGRTEDTRAGGTEDLDDFLDDRMDTMAQQIERAVLRDDSLGGLCADLWLTGTDMSFEQDGAQTVGLLAMTFMVQYQTIVPEVTDEIDDFETADIRYSLDGAQANDDQSHDVVTLPID